MTSCSTSRQHDPICQPGKAPNISYSLRIRPTGRDRGDLHGSELFRLYGAKPRHEGRHKENVRSFLGEIDEMHFLVTVPAYSAKTSWTTSIVSLRGRGNSNATINPRKMAALSRSCYAKRTRWALSTASRNFAAERAEAAGFAFSSSTRRT